MVRTWPDEKTVKALRDLEAILAASVGLPTDQVRITVCRDHEDGCDDAFMDHPRPACHCWCHEDEGAGVGG